MVFSPGPFNAESGIADLIRRVPLCAAMADVEGRILACSPTWSERVSASDSVSNLADVPCRITLPFNPPGEADAGSRIRTSSLGECARDALRSGEPIRLRSQRLRSSDDDERNVHVRIVPWNRGSNEAGGTLVFFHDVTDRVRFGYRVAHDLVAPMNFFSGYIELLREDLESGKTEQMGRMLEVLQGSVQSMSKLVNHLLKLTRTEQNEAICAEINVRDLVEESIRELDPDAIARGASLTNQCEDLVWYAEEFPLRLIVAQLLKNVLANCAPSASCCTVGVRTERSEDGRLRLMLQHCVQEHSRPDALMHDGPSCLLRDGIAGDGWDLFLIRQLAARLDGEVLATRGEYGMHLELRLPDLNPEKSRRPVSRPRPKPDLPLYP